MCKISLPTFLFGANDGFHGGFHLTKRGKRFRPSLEGCVLVLVDYKVIHCPLHALHIIEVILAAVTLSKAVTNILTVNDSTAQVDCDSILS